jgi:C-terminal processing protease CtpA/Prc
VVHCSRAALILLGIFLLARLPASDEDRFDPPLGGVFLGLSGRADGGAILVVNVERFSAAERAGLEPGDEILRLGDAVRFEGMTEFSRAVRGLRHGEPVEVEVLRKGARKTLSLLPDPDVLRDHFRLVAYLRDSDFLRRREGFDRLLAEIQSGNPLALRNASRSSEAYEILNGSLGRLGTSHAAVIPPWSYQNLFQNEKGDGQGFASGILLEPFSREGGGGFYACEVEDGSPAAEAGILRGDEILSVNGAAIAGSPRRVLAGFEASRPHYSLVLERGETVRIETRRAAGGAPSVFAVTADRPLSGLLASRASLRRIEGQGRKIAYLHLWNLLSGEMPGLVKDLVSDRVRYAEGLVVDFRGRGGSVNVLRRVVRELRSAGRPLAILIDRDTRSAKEIAAFQLKGQPGVVLVGEPTAGAVLPGSIFDLPGGARVMLPVGPASVQRLTGGKSLEGEGVAPDLPVGRPGPYSSGADPILEAGIRKVLELLGRVPRKERV